MASDTALELYGPPRPWLTDIYRKRYIFHVVVYQQAQFRKDFMDWLSANWHVWLAFEYQADRIWDSGRRRYSARTIGEFLRHMSNIREAPNQHGWKLNDHYWPDLSRLYAAVHPERSEFFERRLQPLSVRGA